MVRSKIASIQEFSTSAETTFIAGPDAIDVPVREGISRHDLIGLNLFLVMMAQQFPDVMGIRTQDPMMGALAIDPLDYTADRIVEQASHATATVKVTNVAHDGDGLEATVMVENLVGHKFPSGVGFRRAFLTFEVLDELGNTIWASGRTDGMGRLVDANGAPIAGEAWWKADCSARISGDTRPHQPHFQVIAAQDQAQIYQELVSDPGDGPKPQCGLDAGPAGELTTSFLSICAEVKDNRLLPHGYLPVDQRIDIALALGAAREMAPDPGSTARLVGNAHAVVAHAQEAQAVLPAQADFDLLGPPVGDGVADGLLRDAKKVLLDFGIKPRKGTIALGCAGDANAVLHSQRQRLEHPAQTDLH